MTRRVALLLATGPPLLLLVMYCFFSVDYPLMDQWEFPLLLEKYTAGTLTLADLLAQHNEHRVFFPRLIMLGLATLTDWDVRWELFANFFLATIFFGLVCVLIRRIHFHSGARVNPILWPALSMVVFSLAQWENWFLGWQLQVWLNAIAVLGSVLLLTHPALTARAFMAAVIMALVASGSFANGLLVWPIGLVLLLLAGRRLPAAIWTLLGLAVAVVYFNGYERPPYHPAPGAGLRAPAEMLRYTMAYLGQPLFGWHTTSAMVAGWASSLPIGIMLWRMRHHPYVVLPCLGLFLYGVGSAVLTASGRAEFGPEQALSPRYTTFANFMWIAAAGLVAARGRAPRQTFVYALVALLIAANGFHGAYRWSERHSVYEVARPALLSGEDNGTLRYIYPDTDVLLERREILVKNSWSIFAME